jgi:hypothetical protein
MSESARVDPEWLRLQLENLGVPDAGRVAKAYVEGDQAELLRALVLREIWIWNIDAWRDKPDMMERLLDASAADARRRILAKGVHPDDIGVLARSIAYATTFGVLYAALNNGTSDSDADEIWDLLDIEISATDAAWGLHELLVSADPSGRYGEPPEDLT